MMKKVYVLDTNVLIHDPESLLKFEDNEVVLPIYVIEEIDKLKRAEGEKGRNARVVARHIDEMRKDGSLVEGIKTKNGGTIRVEVEGSVDLLPGFMRKDVVDNRIIATVLEVAKETKDELILITKDINMRIKANSLGITVEDYENDAVSISELFTGFKELEIGEVEYKKYVKSGKIKYDEILKEEPSANQFFKLTNENKSYLGIYNKERKRVEKLAYSQIPAWGIRSRNEEQECAMQMLMDDKIRLITLVGKAGTGKTLLALASGLEQVVERGKYKTLYIARPIIPMGKDLGYLPGSEQDKLRPWVQPIYDNFDYLITNKDDDNKAAEKVIQGLKSMGLLKVEALTYIRGRSIPKGLLIIDEAQNLTPHEIKTIVTRAGEGTKLIFTGDPYQIDNPYLDANSNGLTYLAQRFKNEAIAGHITLTKGERSGLAELAAKIL